MRPGFTLVKNNTGVEMQFGPYTIPPHTFGELPAEVADSLRRHPMAELTVLQPEVGPQVFLRTDREPFGVRFRERATCR